MNHNTSSANLSQSRIRRSSTSSSFSSTLSSQETSAGPFGHQQAANNDHNLKEFKACFKNSIKELENILKEYANAPHQGSSSVKHSLSGYTLTQSSTSSALLSSSTSFNSTKEERIHGYLLIILEILRFSCLEIEQQIENYLSIYNLYYQRMHQANNTNRFLNFFQFIKTVFC